VSAGGSGAEILARRYRGAASATANAMADALLAYVRNAPPVFQAPVAALRRAGESTEIVVASWDGSGARVAYRENGPLLLHAWRPGADELLFTTWRAGPPELWTLDIRSGRASRAFPRSQIVTAAAYSPDGDQIAFVAAASGRLDLCVADARGERVRTLTSDSAVEASPSWSADGSRIAFVSSRAGQAQAYSIRPDGSGLTRLTAASGEEQAVRYAPRGDGFAVTRRTAGGWGVFVHRGGVEVEVSGPASHARPPVPAWAPDGELLVYADGRRVTIATADGSRSTSWSEGAGAARVEWAAIR
jgi:TolB protein